MHVKRAAHNPHLPRYSRKIQLTSGHNRSIQRRSTGVDFSPLEQANKSLLHALTVVGFIRFPLATRMRRLSKPKLHSYSVFACARLAVAAVRVVELQLRRSFDRFDTGRAEHETTGLRNDRILSMKD